VQIDFITWYSSGDPEPKRKLLMEMFGILIKSYYLYIMNTTAKIKKRINHDSMWISCQFPSGANFKYRVTRYDSRLEFAFSNDDAEMRSQMKIFNEWLKKNHTTSYGDLFDKLETLCEGCKSGKELITKMK